MRSAWVGLVLMLVACGGPTAPRPVVAAPPVVVAPVPVVAPVAPPTPVSAQVFAAATPPLAFADPDRRAKLAAAFPALDKALEQERVTQGLAGVSIGIVIDGELAYAKGFGVVDPATKTVPDADTVYRIGSISKSFTGLALLSLRDEGVLALEDPLAPWIPEASKLVYPTRDERPITLRQLAQHFGWVHDQTCTSTDLVWHNGAIDSYRADLRLRTSSGIGVVVLSNFGNANTEAFAERAIATLEATGAMKPREPVVTNAFTAVMTKFLDVYNAFDEAKLAAILARPVDPREHDELAGYKALHGTCTAFKQTKSLPNNGARFAFTCERGQFEVDVNFVGADKIGGFLGRSPGMTPPANIAKLFTAAVALHLNGPWSDATYKLVFPKKQIPEAQAREVSKDLHTQFGPCKLGRFTHEGFGWAVDLACAKGKALTLSIQFDPHGDLEGIRFHPPDGTAPQRCPTK